MAAAHTLFCFRLIRSTPLYLQLVPLYVPASQKGKTKIEEGMWCEREGEGWTQIRRQQRESGPLPIYSLNGQSDVLSRGLIKIYILVCILILWTRLIFASPHPPPPTSRSSINLCKIFSSGIITWPLGHTRLLSLPPANISLAGSRAQALRHWLDLIAHR